MFSCLSGGLGNQMFQYSAAYILKKNICNSQLIIDDSYFYCQPQKDTPRNLKLINLILFLIGLLLMKKKEQYLS